MRRLLPVIVACLALAASFIAPQPAHAQSNQWIRVTYRNNSLQCVWMTIYRSTRNVMAPWQIVKGHGADPQMVRPYGSVSVSIPVEGAMRMRNEIKYSCNGGGGHTTHDTQFTESMIPFDIGHANFVLHQDMHRNSYFITASFSR